MTETSPSKPEPTAEDRLTALETRISRMETTLKDYLEARKSIRDRAKSNSEAHSLVK
jgi:hypothetical protein